MFPSHIHSSALPNSHSRLSLTAQVLLQDAVPVLLAYYLTALLVTMRNTFAFRLALLPVTLRLAWSLGTTFFVQSPSYNHLNYAFIVVLLVIAMRVIEWTFRTQPYRRLRQKCDGLNSLYTSMVDAFDLSFNARGLGWCWGRTCPSLDQVPMTSSFLIDSCIRLVCCFTVFDCVLAIIQLSGSPSAHTIYDAALPFYLRYCKSTALAFGTGICIYTGINAMYHLFTICGVLFMGQTRQDWPVLFDSPFSATSLADFWGKRWHQLFRRNFIVVGGKPLRFLFGRLGGVVGVFLVSAVLHDWGMWGMGQGTDFPSVGVYFLLQGLGVILEEGLRISSSSSVHSRFGALWTFFWVVLPCNIMVDAWFQRGLAECEFIPHALRPTEWSRTLLQSLSS